MKNTKTKKINNVHLDASDSESAASLVADQSNHSKNENKQHTFNNKTLTE